MAFVKVVLTGAEYAKARTGKIPAAAKKASRSAVTKIVRQVSKAAKANIHHDVTGLLGKSMGFVVKTYDEKTVGIAGPRKGFAVRLEERNTSRRKGLVGRTVKGKTIKLKAGAKAGTRRDATKYAHLVEKGHKKGKGKSSAPPHKFLAPAAEAANNTAKAVITVEMQQYLRETA